jgi:hypothetical protein
MGVNLYLSGGSGFDGVRRDGAAPDKVRPMVSDDQLIGTS